MEVILLLPMHVCRPVCVCVGGDGVSQELGNIDMVGSTPPSQQY